MVHANATPSRPSLDGTRIAANAGAIAFNGALLLLLLVPLSAPQLVDQVRDQVVVDFDIKPRIKPTVAPPPPVPTTKPIQVRFDQTATTKPIEIVQPRPPASNTMESVVESMPQDAIAAGTGDQIASYTPTITSTDTGPLTGARLAYAHAPAPPYPVDALREGRSGTVILEVLVGLDGKPLKVTVAQSSGQRDLDRLAVRHVESKWRFEPATRNGQPVQAIGRVPIQFSLD